MCFLNKSDIWLSTIIIYLFQSVFNFEKKDVIRILSDCLENLRRMKYYNISAKLMKFALYDELKMNKKNNIFFMSCKKCGTTYDISNPGACSNCKTKILCQIW